MKCDTEMMEGGDLDELDMERLKSIADGGKWHLHKTGTSNEIVLTMHDHSCVITFVIKIIISYY